MSESNLPTGEAADDESGSEPAKPAWNLNPNLNLKIGGLGRKAQKLQSLRDKAARNAAQLKSGVKPSASNAAASFKAKDSFANTKKTTFQRKAV